MHHRTLAALMSVCAVLTLFTGPFAFILLPWLLSEVQHYTDMLNS